LRLAHAWSGSDQDGSAGESGRDPGAARRRNRGAPDRALSSRPARAGNPARFSWS